MRIGILTLPLFCNYGGIVQCYALQKILHGMDHEAIIIQRKFFHKKTFLGVCTYYAKHIVKLLLGRQSSWHYSISQEKRDYILRFVSPFINNNINPRTKPCYTTSELKETLDPLELDAIIVGSDQVWRPDYSPCQPNYFLDFLGDNQHIRRVSYAASFGTDEWTFSEELTDVCRNLIQQFDAVSVREESAVKLCQEYLGVEATQVLDPTMLLDIDDYKQLIPKNKKHRGTLFCYVLDRSAEKHSIISYIAKKQNLEPFESMPELTHDAYNLYGNIEKCVYPPVEDWLSAFDEAKMVVTDSFHGTVFSIIFNKPFWVIGNEGRGMARFQSLLSMFGLEDRLVSEATITNVDLSKPINWEMVNAMRQQLKKDSFSFLESALK